MSADVIPYSLYTTTHVPTYLGVSQGMQYTRSLTRRLSFSLSVRPEHVTGLQINRVGARSLEL